MSYVAEKILKENNELREKIQNKLINVRIFDKDLIDLWELINSLIENEKYKRIYVK